MLDSGEKFPRSKPSKEGAADSEALRMTTTEFLVILRQIRDRFDWSLLEDTGYAGERRSVPRLHIRGTPRDSPFSGSLDPLRAVCYVLTGKVFDAEPVSEVINALDVDERAAAILGAAANDRTWSEKGGLRTPNEHIQFIRFALLEAVGLRTDVSK